MDPNQPSSQGVDGKRIPIGRYELVGIGALVLLAAILRTIHWGQTEALFNDGPVFVDVARAIATGDLQYALGHPYHPLYPALVAFVSRFTGGFETAAVTVSILGGSAAVLFLYAFLRSAFGVETGLVGAALLAVHPLAIQFSGDVQSEGVYMALFAASVALLWRALRTPGPGVVLAAGVVIGLAYLTRPEGLGLALVAAILVLHRLLARHWSIAPALRFGIVLALGASLVVVPYVLTLHAYTGTWRLTQKKTVKSLAGIHEAGGEFYQPPPISPPVPPPVALPDPPATRAGKSPAIRAQRQATAGPQTRDARQVPPFHQRLAAAVAELGEAVGSTLRVEFALLLLVGLFYSRGRPGPRGMLVLVITLFYGAVLLGLTLNVGYVSRRHVLPTLLPSFGYAAIGLMVLGRMLSASLQRLRGMPVPSVRQATAALLILVAALGMMKALRPGRLDALAERRAAEWLRAQNLTPGPVAARKLRVAYYAGAPYIELPERPRNWIVLELRRHGARYVILDEAKMEFYPGLREAVPDGLRPLHQVHAGGRVASVFEVVPGELDTGRGAKVRPEGG